MLQGSTLTQLADKIRRYREARQRAGFDPAEGKVTLMLHTFVHQDQAHAQQLVREPFLEYIRSSLDAHKTAVPDGDRIKPEDLNKMVEFSYERYCREASLIGDPRGCFATVEKCREIGVDEIACLLDFGTDPASILESLPYLEELRALCRVQRHDSQVREPRQITHEGNGSQPALVSADEPEGHFLTTEWMEDRHEKIQIESAESLLFVYSESEALRQPLQEALGAGTSYSIKLGAVNRRLGPGEWEVDVSSAEAFNTCLSDIPRPDFICFVGTGECLGDEAARVKEGERLGVFGLTQLIRSMERFGWLVSPLRLRIITAGIYSVRGEIGSPYFAGLSGLAGSLSKEYLHLDIAALDAGSSELTDAVEVRRLACAIAGEPPQRASQKIAIRGGDRFRLGLNVTKLSPPGVSRFRHQGVYLIVGGAGNVGNALSLYRARFIWVGRRPLDAKIENMVDRVRGAGGEVTYVQGAAEEPETLRAAIALANNEYGSLHGVVHSAYTFQDELLRRLDMSVAREILAAKTGVTTALVEATRELPLDFLLFLNSAQSFFNEARRAIYAAACCFVDAYTSEIRHQVNFPVQVINWGFWIHSFNPSLQAALRQAGLGVIRPEDGMKAIETVVGTGIPQVAYLHANQAALHRMGIDPTEILTYFSESQDCSDEAHAILATQLFN